MGYTKVRKINDHYFDVIDTPLKAYLFFDYLRGYIDGDGCYYKYKNNIYMHITCASLSPLKYIQSKLKEYDIETHIYSENERKHRLMCTNITEMNKLLNHLYYEDGLFCLQRKI